MGRLQIDDRQTDDVRDKQIQIDTQIEIDDIHHSCKYIHTNINIQIEIGRLQLDDRQRDRYRDRYDRLKTDRYP